MRRSASQQSSSSHCAGSSAGSSSTVAVRRKRTSVVCAGSVRATADDDLLLPGRGICTSLIANAQIVLEDVCSVVSRCTVKQEDQRRGGRAGGTSPGEVEEEGVGKQTDGARSSPRPRSDAQ